MTDFPRYEIVIYWSDADEAFIAAVPGLPGCTASGATCREALDLATERIREWIGMAQALGRPVPEPRAFA